jgi:hypothetical protein
MFLATLAAPAGQETDAGTGRGFKVGDKVRVVAELALAVFGGEGRQLQA